MMKLPEVSDYFNKQIIDSVKKIIDLVEKNDKRKFVTLVNKHIDENNLLSRDGFLTLFGRLATELYANGKSDYLQELNFYKYFADNKVEPNLIDLEVMYNELDLNYDNLYSQIQNLVEAKIDDDSFKELVHDRLLDIVYFYYQLHRAYCINNKCYLTHEDIMLIVNNSLEIVSLFVDLIISSKHLPNQKYYPEMFDYYDILIKEGNKQEGAGYETLKHFFGEDKIKHNKVSVIGFCRTARDRKANPQ